MANMQDPWKNRKSVRICVFIDMIFAILVLSVYIARLVMETGGEGQLPRWFLRVGERPGVTAALWAFAFGINVTQFVLAFILFLAVSKNLNQADCQVQIYRSKYWLIFANAVFVMLISKFIIFVFFDKGNSDSPIRITMLILCITELIFKAYAMYFVKEFVDALKAFYFPCKPQHTIVVTGDGTPITRTPRPSI